MVSRAPTLRAMATTSGAETGIVKWTRSSARTSSLSVTDDSVSALKRRPSWVSTTTSFDRLAPGYVNLMWPHHGGLKWPHPPEQPMRSLCCSRSHVEDRGRSFVKARANCPFARSRIRSVSVASCDSHSVYHRLALKNGRRALTSAVGASSAIWWPESIPNPWTSSAHDFHMSSGLP